LNAKFCTSQDSGSSTSSNGFEDDSKDESMKMKIFEAALPLVPQLGWSKECLEAGDH
jgi:ubiquinone biosynthesis protein COQ9